MSCTICDFFDDFYIMFAKYEFRIEKLIKIMLSDNYDICDLFGDFKIISITYNFRAVKLSKTMLNLLLQTNIIQLI